MCWELGQWPTPGTRRQARAARERRYREAADAELALGRRPCARLGRLATILCISRSADVNIQLHLSGARCLRSAEGRRSPHALARGVAGWPCNCSVPEPRWLERRHGVSLAARRRPSSRRGLQSGVEVRGARESAGCGRGPVAIRGAPTLQGRLYVATAASGAGVAAATAVAAPPPTASRRGARTFPRCTRMLCVAVAADSARGGDTRTRRAMRHADAARRWRHRGPSSRVTPLGVKPLGEATRGVAKKQARSASPGREYVRLARE